LRQKHFHGMTLKPDCKICSSQLPYISMSLPVQDVGEVRMTEAVYDADDD